MAREMINVWVLFVCLFVFISLRYIVEPRLPRTCNIVQAGLKLSSSCLRFPNARLPGMHHRQASVFLFFFLYLVLRISI